MMKKLFLHLRVIFFLFILNCYFRSTTSSSSLDESQGRQLLSSYSPSSSSSIPSSLSLTETKKVVIVGAGPAGLLFAHYLLRHQQQQQQQQEQSSASSSLPSKHYYNYEIHIIEKRPDPREIPPSELRTYPVSLQQKRGIRAIQQVSTSLFQAIETEAGSWMKSAHSFTGDQYRVGKAFRSPMLSMDRNKLTLVMLQHLLLLLGDDDDVDDEPQHQQPNVAEGRKRKNNISIHFNTNLIDLDLDNNILIIERNNNDNNDNNNKNNINHGVKKWWWNRRSHQDNNNNNNNNYNNKEKEGKSTINFDYLVAADGSLSTVRQRLTEQGKLSSTTVRIPKDSKSINILQKSPTNDDDDGSSSSSSSSSSFQVHKEAFNTWILKKNETTALALPLDKKNGILCSGVVAFPQYCNPFETMTTPEQVLDFFQQCAPQSLAKLITREEAEQFIHRPISKLYSVKCNQLHVEDKVLLLGDAAHATDNNLGQGANSALEDVQIFFELLIYRYNHDWGQALAAFTQKRLPCVQAVQYMSEYYMPPTVKMLKESQFRQKIRNILGPWLGPLLVGHTIIQLLADTDLSYSEIHKKTCWWTDRIKEETLKQFNNDNIESSKTVHHNNNE